MEDSKVTGNTRVHEKARLSALEHLTIPLEKQVEWAQTVPDDLRGLKVLVVDDSATNRAILHQQLTSWGMSNYVGEDGAQALEMLRSAAEAGEPYELAIIDMQMPGMDDYVPKPVKPQELEAVLGRWTVEVETAAAAASAAADSSGAPEEIKDPIDRATTESLRDHGGSEKIFELAEMFFDDARSGIDAIKDVVERGDAQTVERVAHALKGSSDNLGAQRMAAPCGELQDAGVSGDLTHAPELLEELEVEFARG